MTNISKYCLFQFFLLYALLFAYLCNYLSYDFKILNRFTFMKKTISRFTSSRDMTHTADLREIIRSNLINNYSFASWTTTWQWKKKSKIKWIYFNWNDFWKFSDHFVSFAHSSFNLSMDNNTNIWERKI